MAGSWRAFGVALTMTAGAAIVVVGQERLPSQPGGRFGRSITGAFEGWYDVEDGSHVFLVGYYNRNLGTPMDIPVGPANHIEPGGPDQGQPTHFLPGRQVGVFTVKVPKGFGEDQSLTWTLTANGETTSIPLRLRTDYNVSPFEDAAVRNTPPMVSLSQAGLTIQGPTARIANAATHHAVVGTPVVLPLDVKDDAKYTSGTSAPLRAARAPVTASWSLYRGPGDVRFDPADGRVAFTTNSGGQVGQPYSASSTTRATFAAPGEYVLLAVVNDYSGAGGGGEVCCWTTALVKVQVAPTSATPRL